ncbi:nuclease HARBI1-like protein [Perilla frutescens var. hirtella]|nr:nuclease HARBI1-like protein [Perilla frutescens var. hirtella]
MIEGDPQSFRQLYRMYPDAFLKLCSIIRDKTPLQDTRHICVEEILATFLIIIGHNDRYSNFMYVLSGWEGSTHDSKLLSDALSRTNGLQVPQAKYFLVDCGFANRRQFLAPLRGVQYHLKDFGGQGRHPRNASELFNLLHTSLRNVIERIFGVFISRFTIFKTATPFSFEIHAELVLACAGLHNFLRKECRSDEFSVEYEGDEDLPPPPPEEENNPKHGKKNRPAAAEGQPRLGRSPEAPLSGRWVPAAAGVLFRRLFSSNEHAYTIQINQKSLYFNKFKHICATQIQINSTKLQLKK